MAQTITVKLPDSLFRHLQRAAELFRQPTEVVIAQSLAHSLPPLLDEISFQYQPNVFPLLQMSDEELCREISITFSPEHWSDYEALLDKKRPGYYRTRKKNGSTPFGMKPMS